MKSLIAALALFVAAFFQSGCSTVDKGADPAVVRAEQSISIAFTTFDTFLKIERDNSVTVKAKSPKVHEFAEWLRAPVVINGKTLPRGLGFIESANTVKKAYKSNRSDENKANLITALATLETAVSQAQQHLTAIK